jgi:hypothetical protein
MRLSLISVVMLSVLQISHQQVYPGLNKYYSSHGFYSNNCPILDCDASLCNPGYYLKGCGGTSPGCCNSAGTECTNSKPDHSVWKTNGGTSPTCCTWDCDVNYQYDVGTSSCVLKQCAGVGKTSVSSSDFFGWSSRAGSQLQVPVQCWVCWVWDLCRRVATWT